MPNGTTHLLAGAICGALVSPVIQNSLHEKEKVEFGHLMLSAGTGVISGRIPDIIEPPINPNHRAFFHSFTFGLILGFGMKELWKTIKAKAMVRKVQGNPSVSGTEILLGLFFVVLLVILLHLVMDGFTKRGLPII